jgi:hypothetical protein
LRTWAKKNSLGIGTGTSSDEPPFRTEVNGTTGVANFENYFKVPLAGYYQGEERDFKKQSIE